MSLVRLDERARCAVRVVYLLARSPERPLALARIAAEAGAGRALLGRVLAALCEAGCVERVARPRAGWRLRGPAGELCLADVVDAVEGDGAPFECPLGHSACREGTDCQACSAFVEAELSASDVLRKFTAADLVAHAGLIC